MIHQHPLQSIRRAPLAVAVVAAMLPMSGWAAPKLEFNADMLFGSAAGRLDLSRYEQGDVLPGTYSVDILINDTWVGRHDVSARLGDDERSHFCLGPELFELMGIDEARLQALRQTEEGQGLLALPAETVCRPLQDFVPGATMEFDNAEQRLNVAIPQLYLVRNRRGWVDPALWDRGVTAATLGYSASHSQQRTPQGDRRRTSVALDAGVNLGEWRLRHRGYLERTGDASTQYQAGASFMQRNLPALGAQLIVGESATHGDMLQGVNYRGVSLQSDARMLPDDQREFAPVVRGIAQSNARVTIRQRGYVIHETTVAPGPFEIDDLVVSGASGDLEVEITEADGRVESFTIPFTAMPQLLRPGQQRYTLTAGDLRNASATDEPRFVEATLRRGFSNRVTGYAAGTAMRGYSAVVLGAAWNTSMGAFSGDITLSDARLPGKGFSPGKRLRGQSYRVAYNKSLFADHTNITMAAYRYATDDFLSLGDAARLRSKSVEQPEYDLVGRQRSRLDLTINQHFGNGRGSLYLTGSTADYWTDSRRSTSFSMGYSGRVRATTYTLGAKRTLESSQHTGGQPRSSNGIYLSVSVPLGKAAGAPRLATSASRDSDGRRARGIDLNGAFGDQWQGGYHASLDRDERGSRYSAGASYQLPTAYVSSSYTRAGDSSQLLLGANGGLVLHGGGITLAQRMGETIGLVHIPEAKGVGVVGTSGVRTDSRGYAVVPHISPFRRTELVIDPTDLSLDVELSAGSVSAVPNAGAVVKMVLPTSVGRSALIEARADDGSPLPFGNDVYDDAGNIVGVVGQGSRLWLRGLKEAGQLKVTTSTGAYCWIAYDLVGAPTPGTVNAACRATSEAMVAELDGPAIERPGSGDAQ